MGTQPSEAGACAARACKVSKTAGPLKGCGFQEGAGPVDWGEVQKLRHLSLLLMAPAPLPSQKARPAGRGLESLRRPSGCGSAPYCFSGAPLTIGP